MPKAKRQTITLDTKVCPVEAAIAVAQYCPLDPALYLDRCGLAGIEVGVMDDGCLYEFYGDVAGRTLADHDQVTFLSSWLNLTPGGRKAVAALLLARKAGCGT